MKNQEPSFVEYWLILCVFGLFATCLDLIIEFYIFLRYGEWPFFNNHYSIAMV